MIVILGEMQKTRKRLTSTRFLNLYRNILRDGGIVNLKTDSPFLYEYTRRLVELNGFEVLMDTSDLYGSGLADPVSSIKTFYEQQWLSRGKKIKRLSFRLPHSGELREPQADDIPKSTPQEVALADARKGIAMFTGEAVNVPILGLVENMAWFTPAQHPDERYYIFGEGGAVRLAEEQTPFIPSATQRRTPGASGG